ncbi:hypothetical protein BT63DRAFT_271790 [Microthyrium microscopicum]|uniref:Uncharacterized protein n=1 Tax=Microthyrium microscopicum TaxID=703497 RepID=A0A6A6U7V6_9PEZI|nr:hypothetical protein BT63DRAFT_271790 [Microthyrium microscopicum]
MNTGAKLEEKTLSLWGTCVNLHSNIPRDKLQILQILLLKVERRGLAILTEAYARSHFLLLISCVMPHRNNSVVFDSRNEPIAIAYIGKCCYHEPSPSIWLRIAGCTTSGVKRNLEFTNPPSIQQRASQVRAWKGGPTTVEPLTHRSGNVPEISENILDRWNHPQVQMIVRTRDDHANHLGLVPWGKWVEIG